MLYKGQVPAYNSSEGGRITSSRERWEEQRIKEEWNTEDVVLIGCLPNTYKALGLIPSKEKKNSKCRIA